MKKKFVTSAMVMLMLITSCNTKESSSSSIYEGLDPALVSLADSVFTNNPEYHVEDIQLDSTKYYTVDFVSYGICKAYATDPYEEAYTDPFEETVIDFYDVLEHADGEYNDIGLECYPRLVSQDPYEGKIYIASGTHDDGHKFSVFFVEEWDGWKFYWYIEKSGLIPEKKYEAYMEVLKKKLGL